MADLKLWDTLKELKTKYKWVDLTHELSEKTPHWYGFAPFQKEILFDYVEGTPENQMAPMRCYQYSVASQYGTHVDVPAHFINGGRTQEQITVEELVYPLVVIDKSRECSENHEFVLEIEHIKEWEKEYGKIPENAFVAFRSDWSKKDDIDNKDENGVPHYPGWNKDTIKWLVEERNIGAIGHEPTDTDVSFITTSTTDYPYPAEQYILSVDKIQIEVMKNLDKVPAVGSIIICSFPKIKDGIGSPARVFAICPTE